jgi:hypothetical protein
MNASCIEEGGSCIVSTTLALWYVWAHGLVNIFFVGCVLLSTVSINWVGTFTIFFGCMWLEEWLFGWLIKHEEMFFCGKWSSPMGIYENV